MKTKILLGFLILLSENSHAYPIFYGCADEKLVSTEAFDETDLFKKILRLNKEEQLGIIRNWCEGSETCMKDLQSIITFAGANKQIAMKQFSDTLKKYQAGPSGIKSVKDIDPSTHKKLVQAYEAIKACEDTKGELKASDFVSNGKVKVFYPYNNNYLYITGCQAADHGSCQPMTSAAADQIIEESLIMGTDPYTAISLAVMEGGADNLTSLYLDPIGLIDSLGCSGKQVSNNSADSFSSFGTSYKIEAETKSDPKLSAKLKKYFTAFKYPVAAGSSFYCYDTKGNSEPAITPGPVENSCCFDVGFKIQKSQQKNFERALVFNFINKSTQKPFKTESDPAWRLQRFNGYTDLMGGAEGVPAWRAGVNYYKDPAYGLQAMDYIVNSLITNPWLKEKVEKYEKIYGRPESILCKDRPTGSYYVDSDHYFSSHKNAPRLAGIKEKYSQGVKFSDLTGREKQVLENEIEATRKLNPSMRQDVLSMQDGYKLSDELYKNLNPKKGLFITGMQSPEKLYSKLAPAIKVPKEDFLKAIDLWNKKDKITEKFDANFTEMYEAVNKIKKHLPATVNINDLSNTYLPKLRPDVIELLVAGITDQKIKAKMLALVTKRNTYSEEFVANKSVYNSTNEIMQLLKDPELQTKVEELRSGLAPIEDQIEHYKANLTPALTLKFKKYYASEVAKAQDEDKEKSYKGYFDHVYSKRNTISKASTYSWKKLNETQVQRISTKLK